MGLYLAKLHLEQGDQDGAVAQLRTALAHRPDRAASLDLYYYLARAIRRRGQLTGTPGVDEVADATLALADRLPAAGLPNPAARPAPGLLPAGPPPLPPPRRSKPSAATRSCPRPSWTSTSITSPRS